MVGRQDGSAAEEQADGTIFVKSKKTYLNDENGEPLGAAWYDLWLTPDGEVIRKTEPLTARQLEDGECVEGMAGRPEPLRGDK